jgi:hypothetical protein
MTTGAHGSASAGGGGERLRQLGGPAGPEAVSGLCGSLRGLAAVAGFGRRTSGLLLSVGKAGRGYDGCWAVSCWVGLQRGVAALERGRG